MLKYFYITNNPDVAKIADNAGVDRIFVDLEQLGKAERQPMDTVKNYHTVEDVKRVRASVKNAELLVRINPVNSDTQQEVDAVINAGADVIMLPMWTSAAEVKMLLSFVNGRAKVLPLLETAQAADCINEVLSIDKIDEIHIGLNDLTLSQGKRFLFELFVDGTVDALADILKKSGTPFGVGGVGTVGADIAVPAENILAEHYRVGSSMVILSRSFCNIGDYDNISDFERDFIFRINSNREYERFLEKQNDSFFAQKHNETKHLISRLLK